MVPPTCEHGLMKDDSSSSQCSPAAVGSKFLAELQKRDLNHLLLRLILKASQVLVSLKGLCSSSRSPFSHSHSDLSSGPAALHMFTAQNHTNHHKGFKTDAAECLEMKLVYFEAQLKPKHTETSFTTPSGSFPEKSLEIISGLWINTRGGGDLSTCGVLTQLRLIQLSVLRQLDELLGEHAPAISQDVTLQLHIRARTHKLHDDGVAETTVCSEHRCQDLGVHKHEHLTSVLQLPISARNTFHRLHGNAPSYLTDLLTLHCASRALRSSNTHLLHIPRTRSGTIGNPGLNPAPAHLNAAGPRLPGLETPVLEAAEGGSNNK
ncbi:hypothetical protein XENOCAPTIV_001529 [Xenoophorus captivus]|uniref:Uncharacterized protein n=1 Tax=Xenoophorus captivus TaxID=1517983 RepID=A0ABV0RTC6_9TELE